MRIGSRRLALLLDVSRNRDGTGRRTSGPAYTSWRDSRLANRDIPEDRHAGARGLACCRMWKRWGLDAPVDAFIHQSASSASSSATSQSAAPSPSATPTRAHSVAPLPASTPRSPTAVPAPSTAASCYPLTNSGRCYEPGEYCRKADYGTSGVAGNGEKIVCENKNGWRWEPA